MKLLKIMKILVFYSLNFFIDDGLSINDIITQIKDEKTRLNSEIEKQNHVVSELDEEIRLLEESIKILDFKNGSVIKKLN